MKKIILTILLIAFGGLKIFAQSEATKEEYSVYAKVFEHILKQNFNVAPNPIFVISENTVNLTAFPKYTYSPLENLLRSKSDWDNLYVINPQKGMNPAKLQELLIDFKEKNQSPSKLKRDFPIKHEYTLIAQSELDALLAKGQKFFDALPNKADYALMSGGIIWKPFHEKYPSSGGCNNFSRVGFSSDKNFALVFLYRERGDYGEYTYYIFEKAGNEWGNPKLFGWSRHD